MSTPKHNPSGPAGESDVRSLRESLNRDGVLPAFTDRPKPNRPWGKLAMAASFLFSFSVIGWAFSKPFVSEGSGDDRPDVAALSSDDFQASLTSSQYVEYARGLDRDLNHDLAEKYRSDSRQVSEPLRVKAWKQRMLSRKNQLDQMRKDSGQKRFPKGSLEWQTEQDFLKVLDDTPTGL